MKSLLMKGHKMGILPIYFLLMSLTDPNWSQKLQPAQYYSNLHFFDSL
jgi:hypothetical protein